MTNTPHNLAWYDSADPTDRRCAVEWWPGEPADDPEAERRGVVVSIHRDHPSDTWGPPVTLAAGSTAQQAEALARAHGCESS